MQAAIVTGATSGIGLAIVKGLLELKYEVYGIGRDFTKVTLESQHFHKINCDLLDIRKLEEYIRKIRRENEIYVLINNAGVGYFGLHEELNAKKIHEMVTVNLEVPLLLTQLLLRDLKKSKGFVVNVSSITAKKASPHGCAYGATKAALTHFSSSLFEEARKYGVKVVAIHPDIVQTDFYRNANFKEGSSKMSYLSAQEVADAVIFAIKQREGAMIADITLRPQIHELTNKRL